MSSQTRAQSYFNKRRLDLEDFSIGHLSDETAKLYGRDLFLIGLIEESEILSGNDKSRYTAIVNKISGEASEVFFDLAKEQEIWKLSNGGRQEHAAQVSD